MYRLRRIRPASVVLVVVVIALAVLTVRWLGDRSGLEQDDPPETTGTGQPYADALEARLTEPGDMWAGFTGLTPKQARCVALPWVAFVGEDRLASAAEPEEFAEDPAGASEAAGLTWDEAEQIEAQYERCGLEPKALLARAGITAVEAGGGRSVSLDEIVPCMADKIDADDARRAFVLTLTQPELGAAAPSPIPGFEAPPTVDPDVNRALANAAAACA